MFIQVNLLKNIHCKDCTNAFQEGLQLVLATESEQESVKALTDAHKDKKIISFHCLHLLDQVSFKD